MYDSTSDAKKNFAIGTAANAAVQGFKRAVSIILEKGFSINVVSPTVIEDSPQYLSFFLTKCS